MNTANLSHSLSIEQLLEIERICDSFEQALISDNAADIEEYARRADVAIRTVVREELLAINSSRLIGNQFASAEPDALTQTALPADDTVTLTPQQIPESLGRFRLINQIGAGGTGVVWRAIDEDLRRDVAIKLPHPGRVADPDRFIREARIAAKLQHPHIVRVLEVGREDEQCYLVSDLIDGESLSDLLQLRSVPLREAVGILVKIADALEYSHQNGIVHRDLKPHNILLDAKGHPYVTDFGLAKNCGVDEPSLTRAGQVIGTPAYMAPEQARGRSDEADPRTDVYALGVILFKFLTGDVPFRGSVESVVYQVIYSDPPEPSLWNRNVPRDLETICLKCLEKDPNHRYASADNLSVELQMYLAGEPILARPISTWGRIAKWYKRNRTMAILATAIATLLMGVAVGSSVAAFMLDAAWQRERDLRRDREAFPAVRLAIEKGRRLAPNHPQFKLALKRLAKEALRNGRIDVAHQCFTELKEKLNPAVFDYDIEHGLLWTTFARKEYSASLKHSTKLIENAIGYSAPKQAWVRYSHARVLQANGNADDAAEFDTLAFEIVSNETMHSESSITLERVAIILAHNGQLAAAEKVIRKALEIDEQRHPADHPRVADRLSGLSNILRKLGRDEEATTLQQRATAIRKKQLPASDE